MGENEQGGMLRVVVVIGLIALIASVVIGSIVVTKANMMKNTDRAVGVVAKTTKPYGDFNPNVTYDNYTPNPSAGSGYGDHEWYVPVVGDIPDNNWREYVITLTPNKDVWIDFDVNNNPKVPIRNDHDDISKRTLMIYQDNKLLSTKMGASLIDRNNLKANTKYVLVVKFFNNSGMTLVDQKYSAALWANLSALHSGTADGSAYNLNIELVEAATYDDNYND